MAGPATLEQFDISGRSALVTGAASGLGLAFAECLAEAGAKVTLCDMDAEGAARATQRLVDGGYEARWSICDVSRLDEVTRAVDAHLRAYGGLDICFANAGTTGGPGFWKAAGGRNPDGQIDVFDADQWDFTLSVNLTGVFNTVREAARAMKGNEAKGLRRGGSIIVTTSNAAVINEATVGVPYTAAKAGAMHFMRNAAYELAAHGIRVNGIAPGPVVTNIGGGKLADPATRANWDRLVPLGRMADAFQLKPLALLLASDAGSYMTGSHVVIDGGMQLGPVRPLD